MPTNATAAIAVRDPAEALAHGARRGRAPSSDSNDLGFSFQNVLYKGVRIDAKDMKTSMSVVHLAAQDPTPPPDPDRSSWRPGGEDDAPASDLRAADERRDRKASDRPRDRETSEPDDPAASPSETAAEARPPDPGADDPGFADAPPSDAANKRAESASAANSSDPAAGTGRNAKDAADPLGSQTKAQHPAPAQPGHDGAEVPRSASAAAGQANELAKSLPAGNDLKINVAVAKPGDALFSQPASSLAAASVASGQNPAPRPGQLPVGASAKAGFANAPNLGQTPAAVQPNIQVNGKSGAGDPQLQAGTQGSEARLAAMQSRSAGTTAPVLAGSFADATGIGSSGAPQTAQRAGSGPVPTAAAPAPSQPPVAEQISVQISKAVKAGIDRIDIQLRPKELGRVDVRLELSGDGRVNATVTVDNRETLEMLKSDARGLERALDDAGLKADSNSLNFNLRGQDGRSSGNQLSQASHPGGGGVEGEGELDGDIPARALGDYSRGGLSADGRIDIEI